MDKTETLVLRISSEHKAEIQAAAEGVGESLTTFLTEAALKRARMKRRPPARGVHGGVPTYFRARCLEAANGGANGYFGAAMRLASGLGSQQPYDLEESEWAEEVVKLKELLTDDDGEGVWEWFCAHYPKALALVPTRRREQFVAGVRQAWDDGSIEL